MSLFSKYLEKNTIESILVFGDSELSLKFSPLTVQESKDLSKFKTQDEDKNIDKIVEILEQKCVAEIDGQKLTQEDFLGLDVQSLTQILKDIATPKKAKE